MQTEPREQWPGRSRCSRYSAPAARPAPARRATRQELRLKLSNPCRQGSGRGPKKQGAAQMAGAGATSTTFDTPMRTLATDVLSAGCGAMLVSSHRVLAIAAFTV